MVGVISVVDATCGNFLNAFLTSIDILISIVDVNSILVAKQHLPA